MSGLVGNSRRHVLLCRGSYVHLTKYNNPKLRSMWFYPEDAVRMAYSVDPDKTAPKPDPSRAV